MTIELPKLSIAVALLALPFSASAGWEIGAESVTPTGDFSDIAGRGWRVVCTACEHNE